MPKKISRWEQERASLEHISLNWTEAERLQVITWLSMQLMADPVTPAFVHNVAKHAAFIASMPAKFLNEQRRGIMECLRKNIALDEQSSGIS